ncbi:hypothetical protein [Fluviicola sp.]|uniref:hypothetical protein n=1 Tax=Fluviicola sp. TaxID=1917219 RepID=UPI00261CCAAD|nr:hypothetical protein [Fluviicola sp.]
MKKISDLTKFTLAAIAFLMFSGNAFSQSKIPVETIKTDWNLFQEVKGIKFYAKKEAHTNEGAQNVDYLVIKLENTSNKDITVSYSLAIHFDMGCSGCNSNEYVKTLTIPANSSIEGNSYDGRSPLSATFFNHNLKNSWTPLFISTEGLIIK